MFLDKIQQNSGKILFFVVNVLLIVAGTLYVKQKKIQDVLAEGAEAFPVNDAETSIEVQALQENIATERQQKIQSIANNPPVVVRQKTVAVTKTIPGATRIITVADGVTTSKTSTSSSTAVKKTVSTSAPVPAPTPAATTKTS